MAVSSLAPGVGPTNADIATAVAAPSSSTIATAVAAAVPTSSQITSIVQSNGSAYNGTWTDLGTTNFSTASTVTISGLSGYKQLKVYGYLAPSTAASVFMRLNGDSGSNYHWMWSNNNNNNYGYGSTQAQLSSATGNPVLGILTISPANSTSSKKLITGENFYSGGMPAIFHTVWANTAAVTSITFYLSGGTFSPGNVQIWGLN